MPWPAADTVAAPASGPRREFELGPSDNTRLANLCGPLDENLRLLETRLDVRIHRRGDTFRVSGAQALHAESLLRELFALTQSEDITPERVHLAVGIALGDVIEIDERQASDAGTRERLGRPRPDAAEADHDDMRGAQARITLCSIQTRNRAKTPLEIGVGE